MPGIAKKSNHLKIKQYLTDSRGHKVGAVIEMKEIARVNDLIEDLLDLKAIEDRCAEPAEDYEGYSRKRKARLRA